MIDETVAVVEDDSRYAKVSDGIIVARDRHDLLQHKERLRRSREKNSELNTMKRELQDLRNRVEKLEELLFSEKG